MTAKEKLKQIKVMWENLKRMKVNADKSLRSKMYRRYLQQCKAFKELLDEL